MPRCLILILLLLFLLGTISPAQTTLDISQGTISVTSSTGLQFQMKAPGYLITAGSAEDYTGYNNCTQGCSLDDVIAISLSGPLYVAPDGSFTLNGVPYCWGGGFQMTTSAISYQFDPTGRHLTVRGSSLASGDLIPADLSGDCNFITDLPTFNLTGTWNFKATFFLNFGDKAWYLNQLRINYRAAPAVEVVN